MEKMTEQELVGLKYLEMLRLMVVVKNLEQSIPELVDEITYIAHDSSKYQVKVELQQLPNLYRPDHKRSG